MRLKYKLWGGLSAAFCIGLLAGMILPPIWLVVIEGIMILFITFCFLCS